MLYIEVRTENPLEFDETKFEMAMITISEVYGDKILYKEIPAAAITYVGLTPDGHVYRMGVSLSGTIDGAQWFYGANWYPLEVVIQTSTWHWRPHPVFGFKKKKSTDNAFEAANQIKVTRPADLSMTDDDIVVLHADGTTLDINATVTYGEDLFINITIWNLGDVHITNAKLKVWAISNGVTLDFWELTTRDNFWDPNRNDQIDAGATNNYVDVEITWNTSKTGYDQLTLSTAKIVAHVDILTPVIGGYGSSPIPEIDYGNNDAEVVLVPVSEGTLTVSNPGYVTPTRVDIGQMFFHVDTVTMTASGGGVRVLGMNVTLAGTAQDSDISTVWIARDINDNGLPDPGDYLVDSGQFVGNVFPVDVAMFVKDGRTMRFFVLYDIDGAAVTGRTIASSISLPDDVYVDPTAVVDGTSFPIISDFATIESNKNELTGTALGPTSTFPGSPTVYLLRLNALNTDPMKPNSGSLTITQLDVHITNPANVELVWLFDDSLNIIAFRLPADTVTFDGLSYTVWASGPRNMYVLLNVRDAAPPGSTVGISIKAGDVTLSAAEDTVDPTLDMSWISDIAMMSDFFEWKAGDPVLDVDNTVITNMNIGITDPTVDVSVGGLTIDWAADMPTYTMRVYIDGVLKFEDDGLNHIGTGITIPFDTPMKLSDLGKLVRIEFDMQITKKQPKKKIYNDNTLVFTWHFVDGSSSNGGKYVQIDGFEGFYNMYWQAV